METRPSHRALFVLVLFAVAAPRWAAAVDAGQPAPALVVPELDGKTFDLKHCAAKSFS